LWLQNSLSAQNRIIRSDSKKYGYIRDKYDTTYNTPTPYDPSLIFSEAQVVLEDLDCLF